MARRIPWRVRACLWLALALCPSAASADTRPDGVERGTLIVIGGALRDDNEAVYRAFIERLGSGGRVAVVSAASVEPVASASRLRDALAGHGVEPERVVAVRLAAVDDATTPDIDESEWAANGDDPREIARIRDAAGIWITGGDQSRLTDLLLGPDGERTPVLLAMDARLAAGAVIAGTSAGAAVMSDPMILHGGSLPTLLGFGDGDAGADIGSDEESSDAVLALGPGLGFFTAGITDQHFHARGRLGRLAAALESLPREHRLGYGVDEDTAMRVDLATGRIGVLGEGHVTLVDGRGADWRRGENGVSIRGLGLTLLAPGDAILLDGDDYRPAPWRRATVGEEYYDEVIRAGAELDIHWPTIADTLGRGLLDNAAVAELHRYSITQREDASLTLVRFHFRQTPGSRGYWGESGEGRGAYSVVDVLLDIEPTGTGPAAAELPRP